MCAGASRVNPCLHTLQVTSVATTASSTASVLTVPQLAGARVVGGIQTSSSTAVTPSTSSTITTAAAVAAAAAVSRGYCTKHGKWPVLLSDATFLSLQVAAKQYAPGVDISEFRVMRCCWGWEEHVQVALHQCREWVARHGSYSYARVHVKRCALV